MQFFRGIEVPEKGFKILAKVQLNLGISPHHFGFHLTTGIVILY